MATFKYIQNFFLDAASVKMSAEAGISRVDLFFRGKPKATGNKSGIERPGVELSIIPVVMGVPRINETDTIRPTEPTEHGARFAPRYEIARREWGEIMATTDASIATPFIFSNPVWLKTDTEYGILVKYDGNEDFVLHYSKKNDPLIGSSTLSPGSSDRNVTNFFTYLGGANMDVNNLTGQANSGGLITQTNFIIPQITPDGQTLLTSWKPVSDIDLKFKVYVARYFHQGAPVSGNATIAALPQYASRFVSDNTPFEVSNNVTRLTAPVMPNEFIKYAIKDSNIDVVYGGVKVFQMQPYYPGGTSTPLTVKATLNSPQIIANGSYIMPGGNTFASSNGFNSIYGIANTEYMVIHNGANAHVLKVISVVNSTAIIVDRPLTFSNNNAQFMISPVAFLTGISDSYLDGTSTDMMILDGSNANASCRFVNNQIMTATVNVGGSGYANSDYLEISGYEVITNKIIGGFKAKANLVTNSTGGVTTVNMSNGGCGFVNTAWVTGANVVVKNANGVTSNGTGLTVAVTTGMTLRVDNNPLTVFANCEVTNLQASRIKPEITVNNPLGTAFTVTHQIGFYSVQDNTTFSGRAFYLYDDPSVTAIPVKIFKSHDTGSEEDVSSCIPSRSNQFIIPFANGSTGNSSVIGRTYSNSVVYFFDVSSNNDFMSPFIEPDIINSHYSKYNINNDYTNEHTNYGNAYAKHVATKVNFNTDRQAEDILIYLTAYRPAGTDIKVYSRVHNRTDAEAFDDEDWTLLELIDGIDVYSSQNDDTDYKEYTYSFPKTPNTDLVLAGTVTVSSNSTTTITGSGTAFDTDLVANDLVKIYQPLFSSNSIAVRVVNSVTNSTSFTVTEAMNTNDLVGSGLIIERIRNFKHQAFHNVLNENVVRYYNEDTVPYDTYDTFQVKLVMLSNSDSIVPKIDDVRGVGVTA